MHCTNTRERARTGFDGMDLRATCGFRQLCCGENEIDALRDDDWAVGVGAVVLDCHDRVSGLPQPGDMNPRAAIDRNLLVADSMGKEDPWNARLQVNGQEAGRGDEEMGDHMPVG